MGARAIQNLIKRTTGPHKQAKDLEGNTLVEKLANADREGARAAHVPDGDPVDAPEDVKDVVDPLAGNRPQAHNTQQRAVGGEGASVGRGGAQDIDAVVRAAKAMRDGNDPAVAKQAVQKVCLIVDDSRVIRKVSSKIAKSLGYVPIEAQDGIEALARCKKAMPHLVLTDWDMPEMDGLEFVKQLRAIPTPKAPKVVFCTSKSKAADVHAGIKAGADDYIVKPFDEASLRAKLARMERG